MFHLFFVNDNYYYFFRLHQLLCERLLKMFQQSLHLIEQEQRELNDTTPQHQRQPSVAALLRLSNRRETLFARLSSRTARLSLANIPVDDYYPVFLDMVRNLLDGNMDSSSYEDSLREMFGIHAYIAFTMDKIIHNCVRQVRRARGMEGRTCRWSSSFTRSSPMNRQRRSLVSTRERVGRWVWSIICIPVPSRTPRRVTNGKWNPMPMAIVSFESVRSVVSSDERVHRASLSL